MGGNIIGKYWAKNGQMLSVDIATNEARQEVAEIIKENLEILGIKVSIRRLSNNYYKENYNKINSDILITGNTVSIKPSIKDYLEFSMEEQITKEETYNKIYEKFNQKPNFMGLYFNSINLLCSKKLKGNFIGNWYNIFYNIDTWYKVKE